MRLGWSTSAKEYLGPMGLKAIKCLSSSLDCSMVRPMTQSTQTTVVGQDHQGVMQIPSGMNEEPKVV